MFQIEFTEEELALLAQADINIKGGNQAVEDARAIIETVLMTKLKEAYPETGGELQPGPVGGGGTLPEPDGGTAPVDQGVDVDDDRPPSVDVDDGIISGPEELEGPVFKTGGLLDFVRDRYDLRAMGAPEWLTARVGDVIDVRDESLEDGGYDALGPYALWNSDQMYDAPEHLSNRSVRFKSAMSSSGDFGPKWAARLYNLHGTIANLLIWRAGDFVKGREGHVIYANVLGGLTIEDCCFVQNGAQAIQIANRTHETKIPEQQVLDHLAGNDIVIRRLAMIDPGLIETDIVPETNAKRASWPVSVFNPGHDYLRIDQVWMRSRTPIPFKADSNKGQCRSHGFLHVLPGARFDDIAFDNSAEDIAALKAAGANVAKQGRRYRRFKEVTLSNVDIEITDSDREMCRFGAIDRVELISGRMVHHFEGGANTHVGQRIAVHHDVGVLTIAPEFEFDGEVVVYGPEDDWRNPTAIIPRRTGEPLEVIPEEINQG